MNVQMKKERNEPIILFVLSLLVSIELFISGVYTLFIKSDPKNALIFGLSYQRLLLIFFSFILAILGIVIGSIFLKRRSSFDSVYSFLEHRKLWNLFSALILLSFAWGFLCLICPPALFGKWVYTMERVRPVSIAIGIAIVQTWLFIRIWRGEYTFNISTLIPNIIPFLSSFIPILVLGIFIATTKFGLASNRYFWNVAGMPLSTIQLFIILLMVGVWMGFISPRMKDSKFFVFLRRIGVIPLAIFILAFLLWGLTPLKNQFFFQGPTFPAFQPFPYSDARTQDLGGITILRGYGIFFSNASDKVLSFVYMAGLHLLAGYNYVLMTWLQVFILAFIPVVLFYLGKRFHSQEFGIFLSLVVILRQMNSIILAGDISSVDPKVFMSEELTLLTMTLFAYLLFRWFKEQKLWLAILSGGCIAAASLLRLNPFFVFPVGIFLCVIVFWKYGSKLIIRHLSAYSMAFLLIIIPWAICEFNPGGTTHFNDKINNILRRYNNSVPTPQSQLLPNLSGTAIMIDTQLVDIRLQNQVVTSPNNTVKDTYFAGKWGQGMDIGLNNSFGFLRPFTEHFLHNFTTSVLSMPDLYTFDSLHNIAQQEMWSDSVRWQGELPLLRTMLVFVNLFLIALGLSISWVHHRWLSLIPFLIFVTYSLSLGVAMNSGGRYLVPIDWILYFYYGIALVTILKYITRKGSVSSRTQFSEKPLNIKNRISDQTGIISSIVIIIFVASVVPLLNYVVPRIVTATSHPAADKGNQETISGQENPGSKVVQGILLYPAYNNGSLSFGFLTGDIYTEYSFKAKRSQLNGLKGGEEVYLVWKDQKGGIIESIYLVQKGKPLLFWRLSP